MLYGLIHVRYILTTKGLAAMVRHNSIILLCLISSKFAICQCLVSYSLKNIRMRSLEDAQGFTVVDNLASLLVNPTFRAKARWKYIVPNVMIFTLLDPGSRRVSLSMIIIEYKIFAAIWFALNLLWTLTIRLSFGFWEEIISSPMSWFIYSHLAIWLDHFFCQCFSIWRLGFLFFFS